MTPTPEFPLGSGYPIAGALQSLALEVAELEEMLTAATDTAMQRGKALDAIREYHAPVDGDCEVCWVTWPCGTRQILDGADGG